MTDSNQRISVFNLNDRLNRLKAVVTYLIRTIHDPAFFIPALEDLLVELSNVWLRDEYDGLFIPNLLNQSDYDKTLMLAKSEVDNLTRRVNREAFMFRNYLIDEDVDEVEKEVGTNILIIDPDCLETFINKSKDQVLFWILTVAEELKIYNDVHNEVSRTVFIETKYPMLLRRIVLFVETTRGQLNEKRIDFLWDNGVKINYHEKFQMLLEVNIDGVGGFCISTDAIYRNLEN